MAPNSLQKSKSVVKSSFEVRVKGKNVPIWAVLLVANYYRSAGFRHSFKLPHDDKLRWVRTPRETRPQMRVHVDDFLQSEANQDYALLHFKTQGCDGPVVSSATLSTNNPESSNAGATLSIEQPVE